MNKLIPYALLLAMLVMLIFSWRNVLGYNDAKANQYNQHIEAAEAYKAKEIYIDAVKEYEAALSMQPDNYAVAMEIVSLYELLDQPGSYAEACEDAISADSTQKEPYILLADYYLSAAEYEDALQILNQAEAALGEDTDITSRLITVKGQYVYSTTTLDIVKPIYYIDGSDGYGILKQNDLYGLITAEHDIVIECEYEDIGLLNEDLIPVKKNNEYYYIDEDGYRKLVPDEPADYFGTFNDGYAPASFGGVYGYVDDELEQYNFEYSYAGCFAEGMAAVQKDGKWAVINTEFEPITGFEFEEVLMDEYGFCSTYGVFIAKKDGKYYLYDETGAQISDGFEEARMFASEEPAAVKLNGKWGFVSITGEMVIEPAYQDAASFSLGYAPILKNGKWGCIDKYENILIEPTFDAMGSFSRNGYSLVEEGGAEKYIVVNLYE